MRLADIEEKLLPMAERRWGAGARVLVKLDEQSNRLRLVLPDGIEIVGPAPEAGCLLTQAYSLLSQYVERIDPWITGADPSSGRDLGF